MRKEEKLLNFMIVCLVLFVAMSFLVDGSGELPWISPFSSWALVIVVSSAGIISSVVAIMNRKTRLLGIMVLLVYILLLAPVFPWI